MNALRCSETLENPLKLIKKYNFLLPILLLYTLKRRYFDLCEVYPLKWSIVPFFFFLGSRLKIMRSIVPAMLILLFSVGLPFSLLVNLILFFKDEHNMLCLFQDSTTIYVTIPITVI